MIPSIPVLSDRPVPRRYSVRFLEQRSETPTIRTFVFSTQGTGFEFRSNQAIRLVLPGVPDPWGPARTFSISSSPTDRDRIEVTCKVTETPFKQALAALEPGAAAEIIGPLGDLFYDPDRPAVFLAGGVGVTPFRGMARFARATHSPSSIDLLYSARTPEELAFRSEFDEWANSSPNFRVHYTVTRPSESSVPWTGRTGRIDEAWVREVGRGLLHPRYYVVGLPEMARPTLDMLRSRIGIPEADLEYEYFGGY